MPFIVFKYIVCEFNPPERKIHFRENLPICLGIRGEVELILGISGAKAKKYFPRAVEFFQGFGEINALFLWSKGAKTPWEASDTEY